MSLRTVTIADIAAPDKRSIAIGPFGSSLKADLYVPSGVPVVRGQNIKEGGELDESDLVFVEPETAARFPACLLNEGDLVFPHRGAIGRVGIVGKRKMLLSSSMMKLTVDPLKVDPRFVFYYFRGPGQNELLMRASTVGTPGIGQPLTSLRGISIQIPELDQQRAIAELLGALDDKINANTKLAATADAWIRANLAGLTAESTETIRLSELAANRKVLADPSALDPDTKYVGLEHLPRRSMWADSAGTAASVTSTKARFQGGDILFGKLRPYFHKVVVAPFGGVCSTDVLVLEPSSQDLRGFTLASVASDFVVERATAASEGTRMPRTSWKDLAAVEVAWPGLTEAKEFSARVSALRSSIESLLCENETLATTRDALLPQLMSGNLRVKDAEKVLEVAGV